MALPEVSSFTEELEALRFKESLGFERQNHMEDAKVSFDLKQGGVIYSLYFIIQSCHG